MINDILIKIDDFREERIEDFIAYSLAEIDKSEDFEKVEKAIILVAIKASNLFAATHGFPICPNNIQEAIANLSVELMGKMNVGTQRQLRKKSKYYRQRHGEQDNGQNKQT